MNPEEVSERTVPGVFLRQAERHGDRVLVRHSVDGRWVDVSWSEMRESALRVAAGLVGRGVAAGDRVVIMSENRLEWLFCEMGIALAGAVSVPIYPSTVARTARQIAAGSGSVLAFVADERIASRLAGEGTLREIVRMDADLPGWLAGAGPTDAAATAEIDSRLRALGPDDLATVIYTSGTTGDPKGVVLLHRNFVDATHAALEAFSIGPDDVALSFLPYSHVLERVNGTFVGIMSGASGYIARGIDQLVEDILDVKPTTMVAVPRVYEKMHQRVMERIRSAPPHRRALAGWALAQGRRAAAGGRGGVRLRLAERLVLRPLRDALTGGRLRFFVSGGAPLAREVEEFFWAIGVRILQGWGMTETSSGATSNTESAHRYGTVGRALPGVEIRIAEDGEILVKGPGNMPGYFRNPEATAEVLDAEGWLHTGDVGELDGEGFLRITDRKKDLIKTAGGKYVAPQPIEAALQQDAVIERAVVIGDGRPYCVALIVPDWEAARGTLGLAGDPAGLLDDARLRAHVQARLDAVNRDLGSWESVKYFRLLAEDFSEAAGELTPTLKVKRRAVMANRAAEIDELYAAGREQAPKEKAASS